MSEPQTPPQPASDQDHKPEYGAMASDYPGYDPYLYGHPEQPQQPQQPAAPQQPAVPQQAASPGQSGQQNPYGSQPYPGTRPGQTGTPPYQNGPYSNGPYQNGPYPNGAAPTGPASFGPQQTAPDGHVPDWRYGIDMADPTQNPLYGKWDMYAILALVFTIFFVPVLPAIMGGMAMWRTKTFHMRGFVVALIAVILNVLLTLTWLWMMISGMNAGDLYSQLLGSMPGSGGSGGSDGSGSEQATLTV